MEHRQNHRQLKKTRDYLGSAGKMSSGTIVERDLEDEKYQLRMHGTRIVTNQHGKFLTEWQSKNGLASLLRTKGFITEAFSKSYNPVKEAAIP